jgi:hypothetical protein
MVLKGLLAFDGVVAGRLGIGLGYCEWLWSYGERAVAPAMLS